MKKIRNEEKYLKSLNEKENKLKMKQKIILKFYF